MILKKDNVERIVQSESMVDTMLSTGWADVTPKEADEKQEVDEGQATSDLTKCTNPELKAMLDEKGIEYADRMTKVELIKLLEDTE